MVPKPNPKTHPIAVFKATPSPNLGPTPISKCSPISNPSPVQIKTITKP